MKTILKLKTPLWTGDIDSRSDLIQPAGFMGSLRWWTEVFLRGMDKFVCDPAGDNRCPEENNNNQKINRYCPACLIFGATGMRRLFRLEFTGGKKVFDDGAINIRPDGRNRGWYLGSGLVGQIDLKIIALDRDFNENLLLLPLIVASKWGALGAKTQHGYGVVEFEQEKDLKIDDLKNALNKILHSGRLNIEERKNGNNELPNLKEMFFAKVRFEVKSDDWWKKVDGIAERGQIGQKNYYEGYTNDPRMKAWINSGSVPIAPAIKNWLRFGDGKRLWQTGEPNKDKRIENWLFGTTKNTKSASKINISCAYPVGNNLWEFRIWGWIPENNLPVRFNREGFLNNLKCGLNNLKGDLSRDGSVKFPWDKLPGSKPHKPIVWREFNSSRDTVKQYEENDFENYLQSLINGEEESTE